ncbi:MAG: UDP-N-acetylmuramoyl-tripeptide--D-alanyl-D-alanine ligase, partial [Gammaproteobacteria bacterium]|nr:UDP-N-acetylmuramoyl-tripeptide--D-alanyl-D-alanine ligase [Gammaproteobacteria bacterium]
MMRLSELTALIPQATLLGRDCTFNEVSTDTRNLSDQALFFALRGERFDAHDFADQAIEHGAVALVVEKRLPIDAPQIIVEDTRAALGAAAAG